MCNCCKILQYGLFHVSCAVCLVGWNPYLESILVSGLFGWRLESNWPRNRNPIQPYPSLIHPTLLVWWLWPAAFLNIPFSFSHDPQLCVLVCRVGLRLGEGIMLVVMAVCNERWRRWFVVSIEVRMLSYGDVHWVRSKKRIGWRSRHIRRVAFDCCESPIWLLGSWVRLR